MPITFGSDPQKPPVKVIFAVGLAPRLSEASRGRASIAAAESREKTVRLVEKAL